MKITFIGGGNMASALLSGLLGTEDFKEANLAVVDILAPVRDRLKTELGIRTFEKPTHDALACDVIILAIKPQEVKTVCPALLPHLKTQIVLSIAAGLRLADLSRWLQGYTRLVRAMPNTPALIGAGMTGLFADAHVLPVERFAAERIMQAVGHTLWLKEESEMDALTAISGSGPAYVFLFIEAMQHAAEKLGFTPEEARRLVLATVSGASELANASIESAKELRAKVTSKGGTTEAAIAAMLEEKFIETILNGIHAAKARSETLGKHLGQA